MAYITTMDGMSNIRAAPFIGLLMFSWFCMHFSNAVAATTDTISQGQEITPSETIISAGEIFELGFFTLGNSTNYYVGIWYKEISSRTIVWVANRDYACTSSSPVLTVNNEGNLVIVDGRISYSVNYYSPLGQSSVNVSATLLDSGNFILTDGKSNILWQSFDNPSDTFLPGMKLGINNKTGTIWSYTSWKDAENPDLGDYQLIMDPNQLNQVLLMRGTQTIWSTGALTAAVLETSLFTFHSTANETYFTYNMTSPSVMTRFVVDMTGRLEELSWPESTKQWLMLWSQPKGTCDIYAFCGPFSICNNYTTPPCKCLDGFSPSKDWTPQGMSGGQCLRVVPLQCQDNTSVNVDQDRFLRMDNVKFPFDNTTIDVGAEETCQSDCLNNCSCAAYAYIGNGQCFLWYGELFNLQQLSKDDPDRQTIYLRLAASALQNPEGSKRLLWIIVIVVPLLALLPALYIFYRRKKSKEKGDTETNQDMLLFDIELSTTASNSELGDSSVGKGKRKDDSFPLFSFASVSAATDNFSTENKLGEGGFGPVYKGKLHNGKEVAVKRLARHSGQGLEELKNETMLIAKLQHRNLVRIFGCCLEQGEKMLIYEYLPNKSLDSFLFDKTKQGLLGWKTRVLIIEGIAQGLLYLHQYSRLRIIHRDLKASNILLDGDMNPKISDFGMARMFGGNELQANTNRIVGTYGYMSPEYALEGLFSIKSDVFSFGVLLLEIVSGKKNTGFYHDDSVNLIGYAWNLWKADRALDLMDPILKDQASCPVLMRYINVALLCVQEIAADRPTMSQVVSMLTNELAVLPCPKQPAFSYVKSVINPKACSSNDITVSLMEAR